MANLEKADEAVSELASRPGHEKVRALLHRLLVDGLGVDSRDVDFEKPAPEVRGRIDALLGRTVFELKSDLGRERGDAESALARYMAERESRTGEKYVGIAADGAEFAAYFLRGGAVVEVGSCRADPAAPRELLAWLQGAVALGDGLPPDRHTLRREFGRGSVAARRALDELDALWRRVGGTPQSRLKRALWGRLLGLAYGAEVGDDALFLQHTYLVIVAKAVAWTAVVDAPPPEADALLHGAMFADFGVAGQNEPDFFDWVLADGAGAELVARIARQASRFRLRDIRGDILKALYESLIDPETRHDLGEYYTPDWLAARMVAAAVDAPLERRVIDPACGSGAFLFHAVRAVLAAARAAGLPPVEAARRAAENVAGIDVHPVAVIFARVTWLLALMPALREAHPGRVALPVYLGDALQWNLARREENGDQADLLAGDGVLEIAVPAVTLADPKPRRLAPALLRFPAAVTADAGTFDRALGATIGFGARGESVENFRTWMARELDVSDSDARILACTYTAMRRLQTERRDHIWGYVASNLARPVWLSAEARKADVVIGNPPWVSYRYMSPAFQRRFRDECRAAGLWVGGKVATQQDLSGYFYLRAAALYMRGSGRVALVMPYAALSRQAYARFRRGEAAWAGGGAFRLRFTEAWAFGPEVGPLFPVPSCVLFARAHDGAAAASPPRRVTAFAGALPRRDSDESEADANLAASEAPWPVDAGEGRRVSPYAERFRNGATLVPRRLALVEIVPPPGILPANPARPLVRGRTANRDRAPWSTIEPPRGALERKFVRPVLLGESVAPFRVLTPARAVIPWDDERDELMSAREAIARGYLDLTKWLEQAEALWDSHKRSRLSLIGQYDYYGKLSRQFPVARLRVVYTKAGTRLVAATVQDDEAIIDHNLYWSEIANIKEASYLCGVLNSNTLSRRVKRYQSQGQWGARHFDKYIFNLPIPRFDASDPLHRQIVRAAATAENVAEEIAGKEGEYFTRTRQRIRAALAEHGVAATLDRLVTRLLDSTADRKE